MNDTNSKLSKNSNRYIIFSVLFSARAYYPVLAILFLDLGLSLDQFVFLNLVWAATIFLFEVPSGALADTMGRRNLLIAASILMMIEMLCLLIAPQNGGWILFAFCLVNRICSGLAEACASGADQALAYDSLHEEGRTEAWDNLLARSMRWQSFGFMVAMILGGLVYDPHIINSLFPSHFQLSTNLIHRLPILLVFCQALLCVWICFQMVEPSEHFYEQELLQDKSAGNNSPQKSSIKQAIALTLDTTRWVLTHRILLTALLLGVVMDSIVRNFATINSSYFRLIHLPEWTYGFIGALMGLMGWFVPSIAQKLNARFSMLTNFSLIALGTLIGLIALIPAWPLFGVIPALFLMMMMYFLGFTLSRVLNQEADSARRATVLSVRGLIFNLGYGLFSFAFSLLLTGVHQESADQALRSALIYQLPYFVLVMGGLLLWAKFYLQKNRAQ